MSRTSRSRWAWVRDRWFSTLFLTDMWERFSFFGMLAILFLYATAPADAGGLALDAASGGALVGLYMAAVFLCSVPGGWLGDRVLGAQRATLHGAVLITLGHCCMAVPTVATFAAGIALIALGTGLLKPNMAVLLGANYRREARSEREAGFSIFYMSTQAPALAAPLVIGYLGEKVDWHLGFGAAAVGMAIGLLQYRAGLRHLNDIGRDPGAPVDSRVLRRYATRTAAGLAVVGAGLGLDVALGTFTVRHLLAVVGLTTMGTAVWLLRSVVRHPGATPDDRRRLRAYVWVFLVAVVMWALFSQSRSVLAAFAVEGTDRSVGTMEVPASWFQSLHPLFVLLAAPFFAWLWLRLRERADLSVKLAVALGLGGLSYLVLAGAIVTAAGGLSPPVWIVLVFLLQACGELAFGPVTMGVTIEVAPAGLAGRMMGLWWLAGAVGAGLGGLLSGGLSDVRDATGFVVVSLATFVIAAAVLLGGRLTAVLGAPHDAAQVLR